MEILNTFGVDIKLFIAQVVNFLIVLYLLRRLLYKPLLTALQDRKKTIAQGLQQAEEGRLLLEKASEKERAMRKIAQEEARRLLDEAKKQRILLLKETESTTKKQAEKILADAQEQITLETKEAEKRLATHVSELAVLFLQKSVHNLFTQKEQDEIVKNAMKKMKGKTN
ncbi:MAG: F0F1 ATP synthase subunit B [Candidatus Levybacteria bacterium]|nr:F0F1 ATP synthase subunit B [Candidatus Levybacteria bacterium]